MPGRIRVNQVEFIGMRPNLTREAYKCYPSEFTPIFTSISCPVELGVNPWLKLG